jgi:hypothetical protein
MSLSGVFVEKSIMSSGRFDAMIMNLPFVSREYFSEVGDM